jgi:acetyl-CoA carboxylase biotin carboxyl carrier protein
MKAKEIKELIHFIAKMDVEEVKIETDEYKLEVKRRGGSSKVKPMPVLEVEEDSYEAAPQVVEVVKTETKVIETPRVVAQPVVEQVSSKNLVEITSPMIGTFYRSSKPENPPFAKVGDKVKKGQVVCIIEAMKLFNEIESEVSGTIVKVNVENASPVEFGQVLFVVDPS